MNKYISQFLEVIRNCSTENTYKMAWAKSIVEICFLDKNVKKITLHTIAINMFKYYWNQTIYFDLVQGSNLEKPPAFISIVKKEIEKYFLKTSSRQPIHFERASSNIDLNSVLPRLVRILKQDVSYRFLFLSGVNLNIYQYHKGNDYLIIKHANAIHEYHDILVESINFRWTQILENFNNCPRIAKKVRVLDLPEIKRSSLNKYREYLDVENPLHHCFICGDIIVDETPSIDHVIPWSFIFSDDLWNLVYTHRKCNSSKSNATPTIHLIKKLENRNRILLNALTMSPITFPKKPMEELNLAIVHDYVNKFWINFKN